MAIYEFVCVLIHKFVPVQMFRCCMLHDVSDSNSEQDKMEPIKNPTPTFLSTIHHRSSLHHQVIQVRSDGKLGHGRECTKENGARYSVQLFADCFRLRGKHGGVSRYNLVISSPWRSKECCMSHCLLNERL